MSYLLDTDICIYILNGGNPKLEKKFRSVAFERICVSTITQAELYYGALHSLRPQKNLDRIKEFLDPLEIIPFDSAAALAFAQIKESLVKKGNVAGSMDMLIAAVAKAHDFSIVTNNLKHFKPVPGIAVENWA